MFQGLTPCKGIKKINGSGDMLIGLAIPEAVVDLFIQCRDITLNIITTVLSCGDAALRLQASICFYVL